MGQSSRRSKLTRNWVNNNSNNTIKLQNDYVKIYHNNSGFKNDNINLRHIAKISILNNDNDSFKHKKINSVKKLSTTTTTSTTKAPTVVKNLVVIRPVTFSSSSSPFLFNTKHRQSNITIIKKHPIKNYTVPINLPTNKQPDIYNEKLKNWPNEPPNTIQDFINYEKYTSIINDNSKIKKKPLTKTTTIKPIKQNINSIEKPSVSLSNHRQQLSHPNVQEIIQWLQIPPFSSSDNESNTVSQDFKPGQSFTNAFEPGNNENLSTENINSLALYDDEKANDFSLSDETHKSNNSDNLLITNNPVTMNTQSLSTTIDNLLTDNPTFNENKKRPVYRPTSEVSQDTIVQIINPLSNKQNTSINETHQNSTNTSTLKQPPNVHIMFMPTNNNQELKNNTNTQESQFINSDCPTITINSITKINNTIQSKEGCTDLNIIINSQVLSTNNFDADIVGLDETEQNKLANSYYSDANQNSDGNDNVVVDGVENNYPEKHLDHIFDHFHGTSSLAPPTQLPEISEPPQPQPTEQIITDNNHHNNCNECNSNPSPYDVNQETNIEYAGDALAESEFSEAGSVSAGQSVIGSGISSGSAASNLPSIGNQLVGLAGAGVLGNGAGSLLSGGGGDNGDSTALTTINLGNSDDDDDDDDDDMFGLSPTSVLDGVTSIFTYLTILNPLNYGIFTIAAAPLAALAAGVLGIGAMFFPWAFTTGLDFARASDQVTIRFTPNIDEVVRQSLNENRNWEEWKSKRRKSRRR